MNVCEVHPCCLSLLLIHAGGCVLLLRRNLAKKRTRVFEDDVFIENTRLVGGSKTQDLNLRADAVLDMSRGSPGQWFPVTEYWASAIFVGTSGIPPKIIYRSVKSYTYNRLNLFKEMAITLQHGLRTTSKSHTSLCDGLLV